MSVKPTQTKEKQFWNETDPYTTVQRRMLVAIQVQNKEMAQFIDTNKMQGMTYAHPIREFDALLLSSGKPGLHTNTQVLNDARAMIPKLDFVMKEIANFLWVAKCDEFIYPGIPQNTSVSVLLQTCYKCRRCLLDYIEYCELRRRYSRPYYFHPPPDCDCSVALQSYGIAKKDANHICDRLGSLLVRHLQYLTYADYDSLALSADNLKKLQKVHMDVVYSSTSVHASTVATRMLTAPTTQKADAATATNLQHMRTLLKLKQALPELR
jgi:hypothetical protein